MCYCCRKLEIRQNFDKSASLALIFSKRGQFCERGHEILVPDWIRQICERGKDAREANLSKFWRISNFQSASLTQIGLSHSRPLPLTHVICLSQSAHDLTHGLSHTQPLSHTASLTQISLSHTDRPLSHSVSLTQITWVSGRGRSSERGQSVKSITNNQSNLAKLIDR